MVVISDVPVKATLGIKSPLLVEVISSIDAVFGDVVPIPTCAKAAFTAKSKNEAM